MDSLEEGPLAPTAPRRNQLGAPFQKNVANISLMAYTHFSPPIPSQVPGGFLLP